MSHIIAITFDGSEHAVEALRALRRIERQGLVRVTDTAVIRMGLDRPARLHDEPDGEDEPGVSVLGTLGPSVAIARRVAGVVSGPAGGAWAVTRLHDSVDWRFLALLGDDVRHGTSVLLVTVADMKPRAVPEIHEAMRPIHCTVYETTLSPEPWPRLRYVAAGPCDCST